jgi:hypothetical protein
MTKDRIGDHYRIESEDECIDDQDRALNPIGRFYRHNAMHAGTTRMVLDEFGRCAKCVWLLETGRLASHHEGADTRADALGTLRPLLATAN